MAQDVEFGRGDLGRLLLQRIGPAIGGQEADEMAGRADGQIPEAQALEGTVGGPIGQRLLPRQVEQLGGAGPEPKPGEADAGRRIGRGRLDGQSFLRR
jgi:hypothetical protein